MAYIRLNKHFIHQHYLALGVIEVFTLVLAAWLAVRLPSVLSGESLFAGLELGFLIPALIFSIVLSCCTLAMGVYISLVREGYASMVLRTIVSFFLLGSLSLYVVDLLASGDLFDSAILFWGVLFATLMVFVIRALFITFVDLANLQRRILVYGAGQQARGLLDRIASQPSRLGVTVVGCVPAGSEPVAVDPQLLMRTETSWLALARAHDVHEIVMAPDERRRDKGTGMPVQELLDCKVSGIPTTDLLSFEERELNAIDVDSLKPSWLLFSDGFRVSRRHAWAKRLFDVAVSGVFLAVLWPAMLLTALAVKLDSKGPALYSQLRVGLNGQVFRIYKFRSMRTDAEVAGKAVWAKENDNRVTRVGAFIRNTRLDELPQLYNVLAGHMSFVGPRPERPEFVEELKQQIPFYDVRHKVKPGLMGWAQLKYPYGASVEDAKNKLKYDLYYAKNHGFLMDLQILVQTVEIVLLGKGVR